MSSHQIVLTTQDYERLCGVLQPRLRAGTDEHLELLEQELDRAQIVRPRDLDADVLSMNSEFVYEDVATGTRSQARLVYPDEADIDRGCISVFAPLGSALLGMRAGEEIAWKMPRGVRRLRLVEVTYQPEAAGHWSL